MSQVIGGQARENAILRDDAEKELVKEFRDALHGGMSRDTFDNSGVPFTGDRLEETEKRINDLIDDKEFQALLLQG